VFRLTEHMQRLDNSAKILGMEPRVLRRRARQAVKDTVRSTGLPSCYVRPIAYYGYGEMGLNTMPCSVDVAIACWPWGAYLGDDALTKGVRMKISSWTRHDHNIMPPAAKTTGNYVNSSLAKVEALKAGYDEAIMLNRHGLVAECTGENIFVSRGGRLITPPLSAGALEGITQDTVMTIARDLGFDVAFGELARSDLYVADEMFVCGTAAEVSAVNSVDDRHPLPRPQTRPSGHEYAKAVRGQVDKYKDWSSCSTVVPTHVRSPSRGCWHMPRRSVRTHIPLQLLIAGVNAHINYDLVATVVDVLDDEWRDARRRRSGGTCDATTTT
jgi:branched-chain amino acid aminotransferase